MAKVAGFLVVDEMAKLFSPRQLGYSEGVEAALHAARKFPQNLADEHAMVKLGFRNAFSSVHKDRMLEAVHDLAPFILFVPRLNWKDVVCGCTVTPIS